MADGLFTIEGVAAVAALILSQVPPLRHFLRRPRLVVEPYQRVALNNDVGLPIAQWQVSITNAGGRDVRIKKIELIFHRDGGDKLILEGRGYFETPSASTAILLTPFALKPEEVWSYNVSFGKQASRDARQAYAKHFKALRENITSKRAGLPENSPEVVEGDKVLVQPFIELFDSFFYWRAGEYEAELRVETDSPKANTSSKYRFTLFESESDALREHRDALKFGFGTLFPHRDAFHHFAEVTPSMKAGT